MVFLVLSAKRWMSHALLYIQPTYKWNVLWLLRMIILLARYDIPENNQMLIGQINDIFFSKNPTKQEKRTLAGRYRRYTYPYTHTDCVLEIRSLNASKDVGTYRCQFADAQHRSGSDQLDVTRLLGKFQPSFHESVPFVSMTTAFVILQSLMSALSISLSCLAKTSLMR